MTIKDLLKKGAAGSGAGDTALLNAEVLLADVLGCEKEYLLAHGDCEVLSELAELFDSYILRAGRGEPVAYIINRKEFFGLDFYVDDRVLVPRPETELLVEKVLDYLRENDDGRRRFKLLDMGTGSGNISVSIAKNCDMDFDVIDEIEALDLSEGACEVAKLNVEQHGVEDKVNVFQSDLLEVCCDGAFYDVIVANLPYIGENDYIAENVKAFEPYLALDGGKDGCELYKKMFQEMSDKKMKFGLMIGEFSDERSSEMEEVLNKYFEQRYNIGKDFSGSDRMFIIN